MGQNLTGQLISATYEDLVQISGSILTDGLGADITSLTVTSSFASNAGAALTATSASFATNASTADNATSASYALSASYAANATIDSGSFMITGSVSSNTLTFEKGDGSTFSLTVNTGSAVTVNTGSLLVTASISDATITFTKGDASTFDITVNNVLNATSASFATTAASATTAISASYATNAGAANTATSASHALFADNAGASSTAISASHALNADNAISASFAITAGSAGSATTAISASHAVNADTASLALNIVNGLSPTFDNITVTNTASFGYVQSITGSAVYVGDSFLVVNADSPALRYAGIRVFDSGSSPIASASLEWDSLNDTWIAMEETGNTAVMITGPTGSRGSETYLGFNKIQKGLGWNYIGDSSITDDGTTVSIDSNTEITGSLIAPSITGSLEGTASFAITASFALNAGGGELSGLISGSGTDSLISANYQSTASLALGTESIAIGNNTQADSANQIILGTDITSSGGSNDRTVVIGTDNILQGTANDNVIIGNNWNAQGGKNYTVAIGHNPSTNFLNPDSVLLGYDVAGALAIVAIGRGARGSANNAVAVGYGSGVYGEAGVSVGQNSFGSGQYFVSLGYDARNESSNDAITIGKSARTNYANNSIVIGANQVVEHTDEINIGGKFRYNSGSNGIIELYDDTLVYGSIRATGSIALNSGSINGQAIDNLTDTFTSTAAVDHIVSLTQAEYNTISGSASPNTLYYITDAPSFVTSASYAVSASHAVTSNTATTALTATSASFATTALNATSASFATTAASASYVLLATSASFATTATSASYALTASFLPDAALLSANNTFIADQIIQSASLTINGPVYGGVSPLTISSNTASMDLTANNFFTLQLVSGSNTFINPSNITAGQTINLLVSTTGSATVSFPSSVKQVSGSVYVPTTTTSKDIVTFIAFDATNLYLSNVKNLV